MVEPLRPSRGGPLRPFPTAWFIIEFLKGKAPEGSKRIDPLIGAPMSDINDEYRSALHRIRAKDIVEREEERRIRKGSSAYTEEQYIERLEYFLNRTPHRSLGMTYASFTRYFGQLKRLGWVEEASKTEPSTIQEDYPGAPPRVYYRLTRAGRGASPSDLADPVMTLYQYSRTQRSAKSKLYVSS